MPRVTHHDGFNPMKKLLPALALLTLCASVCLAPSSAAAVPKMDVKVAVGVGSTTLVPRVPTIDLYDEMGMFLGEVGGRNPATFSNWGMQLSARVTAGKIFVDGKDITPLPPPHSLTHSLTTPNQPTRCS